MKKTNLIFSLISAMLLVFIFSAFIVSCSEKDDDGKFNIVCTIFPEYEFINEIIGEKSSLFNITMLLDNGSDMHSFQPTIAQIAQITDADFFCYIGGSAQNWINNILKNVDNNKVKLLSLANYLENDLICNDHGDDHQNHDHSAQDEHIWLSLKLAKKSVVAICEKICEVDPENKDYYNQRATDYISRLDVLDKEFETAINNAVLDTVIVADRFPFVYLFNDYNIKYYAAFEGCSSESDASVKTIIQLATYANELSTEHIIVLESSDRSIANAVIKESGRDMDIVTLDSCQTITKNQIESGARYIDIMKNNLEGIKKALGCQ